MDERRISLITADQRTPTPRSKTDYEEDDDEDGHCDKNEDDNNITEQQYFCWNFYLYLITFWMKILFESGQIIYKTHGTTFDNFPGTKWGWKVIEVK